MKQTALIFTGILLAAGLVFAASGKYRPDKPYIPGPGMGVNARASVLTEDQQKAFDEVKLDHQKKLVPLRAEMRVLRMEIDNMIREGKSEKDIRGHVNKLNDLRASLNEEMIGHRIATRELVGEDYYLQMGRRRNDSGRGVGPDPRMERNYRSNRRYESCMYGSGRPRSRR
ncbi:MAG: periplasmic heavy metal sensor [Candidatus Marinimicrobia bacterium]|nr:periplasmic heavy metal sensor [Candidatus Neomarinimicrobiota bacterium]